MCKPHLVVQLESGVTGEAIASVVEWLRPNAIATLNVAGPRESKRPGISRLTVELLEAVDIEFRLQTTAAGDRGSAR